MEREKKTAGTATENEKQKEILRQSVQGKLARYFGVTPTEADPDMIYRAVAMTVKDLLSQKRADNKKQLRAQKPKRIYYLCMEFLVGKTLCNNLRNLGLYDAMESLLWEMGYPIATILEREPDPGLGNGGLGRLAACYMDALTTQNYAAMGYSLLYEYGLFRQRIVDGEQIELPDDWLPQGEVNLVPRPDKACTVSFGGHIREQWHDGKLDIITEGAEQIRAVPYDLMISGADCGTVNVLRLWRARSESNFNMKLFSQGEYERAMEQTSNAEVLTKVLYPADNHTEGKLLRLSQQYFLVCASLQTIIADHLALYGTLDNFADAVAIHINDTHPALVIPELMRILVDIYSYPWESAWGIVQRTVSYTNHTVMPEALECWNEDLFGLRLPRIHAIVKEINRRFCAELWNAYPGDWDRISRMSVICNGSVRMANLSVIGSDHVNGVSALHSDILKKTIFHDFDKYTPDKFTNVTNGIAHRRWLCYSNTGLSALLDECIGPEYRKEPQRLAEFAKFKDDASVLDRLAAIKRQNKENFASVLAARGIVVDPASVFDVQIKRLHEYKRQLLNALRIIALYLRLRDNPGLDMVPQTFIFGAKAAPGYQIAKQTIRLICAIGREIEKDPKISKKLRVVFPEEYNVTLAEQLIPAADISEQISLAGKEASGTGCMKLMLNGALTIGTLDGANVEILEAVGRENMYLFGLDTGEVDELWKRGYNAASYYMDHPLLHRAVDRLAEGFDGIPFRSFVDYLIIGPGIADPYLCLADFDSYYRVHEQMIEDYRNEPKRWQQKSLINIAGAGRFSADRAIREYAERIWHAEPMHFGEK